MMKTLWIHPNDIADVWTVNNRKENLGHIESLAESMRQNGYLPEYPIIAFEAANIPIETDKPYVMACGHHRRKAALAAEIDLIFAEVHDGTEEEWIEMMSLDNFQFDVASNPRHRTRIHRARATRRLFPTPPAPEISAENQRRPRGPVESR